MRIFKLIVFLLLFNIISSPVFASQIQARMTPESSAFYSRLKGLYEKSKWENADLKKKAEYRFERYKDQRKKYKLLLSEYRRLKKEVKEYGVCICHFFQDRERLKEENKVLKDLLCGLPAEYLNQLALQEKEKTEALRKKLEKISKPMEKDD